MIESITKRDGRQTPFNIDKIAKAIYKAAKSVGGADYSVAEELAEKVETAIMSEVIGRSPSVEEIQDMVEKILIENGHAKTAKAYILYRAERTRIRESNTSLMKTYEDLTFSPAIKSDIKRENANINGDTAMGTMLKYGSEGAKKFNLLNVLDPDHAKAHIEGDIHVHDLDFYTLTTTCCQIDLQKLFNKGFSTGHGNIRTPNSIQTYAALACIAIQSNQNDQHGGQSIPAFDYYMADGVKKTFKSAYIINFAKQIIEGAELDPDALPQAKEIVKRNMDMLEKEHHTTIKYKSPENHFYFQAEMSFIIDALKNEMGLNDNQIETIRKYRSASDKDPKSQLLAEKYAEQETERATYQAMEALIHNLNTMNSRAGAQVPFSSINYGTDTSPEGRLVIKSLLEATENGLGNGETPIFPVQIFKVKDGVNYNPDDPNYDLFKLAMETSAKRMFPNFSFIDAPFNLKYYNGTPESEVCYMGCRTRVMGNIYDPDREITPGRGNLSFTTINLPRLAIEANHNINKFYESLDKMMELVVKQLVHRYRIIAKKTPRNFPFLMAQGVWIDSDKLGIDDEIGEILKHGTLSIGFIGLAETLIALIGKHHGESEDAQKLGLEIISHMRKFCDDKSKALKMNVTLLATPAEGLSGRFIAIDKKRYGEIPGITDKAFYTNSYHIPVYYNITAFKKIKLEAPYHELTNAGHITYVEMDGDPTKNLKAFEQIVRCMHDAGIGYGAINHPIDHDPCCGYNGIINDVCPKCGRREHIEKKFTLKRPKK